MFTNRELLLVAAISDGTDATSQSFKDMKEAAKMKTLPGTQVSYRTNIGDVLTAGVCIQ